MKCVILKGYLDLWILNSGMFTYEWKDNIDTNRCSSHGKKPLDHLFQPHCIAPWVSLFRLVFLSFFFFIFLFFFFFCPNLLQMSQLGCFLDSTLRRMVCRQIRVCRMWVTRSMVLVRRHLRGTVVVHACRLVVW